MAFLGKQSCPLGNNRVSEITVCRGGEEEENALKKQQKQYFLFNTNFLQDFLHNKSEK